MPAETPRAGDSEPKSNDSRRRVGLLALGSAAVLSIYSAGFIRTGAAAQRIAQSEDARHSSVEHARVQAPELGVTADAAPATAPAALAHDAEASPVPKPRRAATPDKPVTTPPSGSRDGSVTTTVAKAVHEPAAPPVAPATAPEPIVAPVEPPPSAAVSPAPTPAPFKDGSYSGWGTSRHGDIEATIEIKGGRIVSAEITDCRTRYSCSRIAALPPQVLARQSPDVDYVSGATQSSDAYYYAVVEALKKAK